jgi:hypothetical protein
MEVSEENWGHSGHEILLRSAQVSAVFRSLVNGFPLALAEKHAKEGK